MAVSCGIIGLLGGRSKRKLLTFIKALPPTKIMNGKCVVARLNLYYTWVQ